MQPWAEASERARTWLSCARPVPDARVRLFCFHHAGGSPAFFRFWPDGLRGVELLSLRLPGRETRLREPLLGHLRDVVEPLAQLLPPLFAGVSPVLFGHSLGGLLAFELARELRRRGLPEPALLCISGRRAPTHADSFSAGLYKLSDEDLLASVQMRYGGIPKALLDEPELVKLMLPVLRADLTLLGTHQHEDEPPLACPIRAYGGSDDLGVPSEALEAWAGQTTGSFVCRIFRGDHFYMNDEANRRALLDDLSSAVIGLARR